MFEKREREIDEGESFRINYGQNGANNRRKQQKEWKCCD